MNSLEDAAAAFDEDLAPRCTLDPCHFDGACSDSVVTLIWSVLQMLARGKAAEGVQVAAVESLQTAIVACPIDGAVAMGSFLRTLGGAPALPKASQAAVLVACRIWCRAHGAELAINALVTECHQSSPEAVASCVRWLYNFSDLVSPFVKSLGEQGSCNWLDAYPSVLVDSLIKSWHRQFLTNAAYGQGPDLCARLSLRGEAPRLAANFCAICLEEHGLHRNGEEDQPVGGQRFADVALAQVAENSTAAICSLVDAMLQASSAVFCADHDELTSKNVAALNLLPCYLGPLMAKGSPIHHLISDRIWRRSLGGQLSAAVVFALVDFLKVQPDWPGVRFRWCQRWAEESLLKNSDFGSQRAFALRLVRMLACTVESEDRNDLFGSCMSLLLQGVHIRLSAQVDESRWYGMAVAEAMGRNWPQNGSETRASLHFDGFDLVKCGLGVFRLADSKFKISGSYSKCESMGAQLLRELLTANMPNNDTSTNRRIPEVESLPVKQEGTADLASEKNDDRNILDDLLRPDDCEVDSDDDEDDPLHNLAPLPALHTSNDTCTDLLLVQPPRYLRGAYEMLLGPSKEGNGGLSGNSKSAHGQNASPEMPAVACARVRAALEALPSLVKADVPELSNLAEPLCARLLHMGDVIGLEDLISRRKAALVSLLLSRGSRSAAVRFLILQFGAEDLMLMTRVLILNVLSDAAKQLSTGGLDQTELAELAVASKARRPSIDPPPTVDGQKQKTRRFASATRVPVSQPNLFAAELRTWLLPLLGRWRRPDAGAAKSASVDPMLVGGMLQCTGVLIECAGRACPDRDAVADKSLDLVEEFWGHSEPRVRRCSVFLLSRVLLVGADDLVLNRPTLLDHVELALLQESDDMCRKMIAGIMAWIQQRSVC